TGLVPGAGRGRGVACRGVGGSRLGIQRPAAAPRVGRGRGRACRRSRPGRGALGARPHQACCRSPRDRVLRVMLMARRPSGQQLIALGALAAAIATIVIALLGFIRYPLVIALSFIAVAAVFEGVILIVTTSNITRWVGVPLAIGGIIAWIWILIDGDVIGPVVGMLGAGLLTTVLTLWALRPVPYRPPAERTSVPTRPFILMNPRSGGGRVKRFDLDGKARELGAQVVLLEQGLDPIDVLEQAVNDGADLLGAAGGDGTQ